MVEQTDTIERSRPAASLRTCVTAAPYGVTLPSPGTRPDLDPSDSTIQQAFQACAQYAPSRGAGPPGLPGQSDPGLPGGQTPSQGDSSSGSDV